MAQRYSPENYRGLKRRLDDDYHFVPEPYVRTQLQNRIYRDQWHTTRNQLFVNPGTKSKIWYLHPRAAGQLLTPAGSKRYPTFNMFHNRDDIPYNEMPDTLKDLYTYMGAFNETQRGEVVEAFTDVIMSSYVAHDNDDYIVDGYDSLKRVDRAKAEERRQQLFDMEKDGRHLGQIANHMMQMYTANIRGVFEPRHEYINCVPVEVKTVSNEKKTNAPSLAQAIYLWMFQGKLLHVARLLATNKLVVRKTDFDNVTDQEFAEYVQNFI